MTLLRYATNLLYPSNLATYSGNASKRQRTSLGQGQTVGLAATAAVVSSLPIADVPSTTAASGSGNEGSIASVKVEGNAEGGDVVLAPPPATATAESTSTESAEGQGLGPEAQEQGLGSLPATTEDTNQANTDDGTTSAPAPGLGLGLGLAQGQGLEDALMDDDVAYSSITGKHLSGHEDRTVYVTGIHACCNKAGNNTSSHSITLSLYHPFTLLTDSNRNDLLDICTSLLKTATLY